MNKVLLGIAVLTGFAFGGAVPFLMTFDADELPFVRTAIERALWGDGLRACDPDTYAPSDRNTNHICIPITAAALAPGTTIAREHVSWVLFPPDYIPKVAVRDPIGRQVRVPLLPGEMFREERLVEGAR